MFLDARFPSIVFSWLNDFHTCLLCRVVLYDRILPKRGGGGQGRKLLFMSVTMREQMYTCSFFFQREKKEPSARSGWLWKVLGWCDCGTDRVQDRCCRSTDIQHSNLKIVFFKIEEYEHSLSHLTWPIRGKDHRFLWREHKQTKGHEHSSCGIPNVTEKKNKKKTRKQVWSITLKEASE